ncbi:histidine phosphatase family protein [Mucilaginibacter sp. BJC16-A38]|uniref:SixA phosphatase family protein n=1 Tax=Mucilaginibacter phenanthrenivorans TaxID=1234842 RepID=UPI00215754BF|nr:histidine phosphatase family protein [Mucilaginibacter phenanthrenivorans]MCR8559837.1 histidine phosphatase family protein [Mucilaginibacter phenanthrenivorans]
MKKLLLVRHAKAEKDAAGRDFDRPLKYIGMQDAGFMADRIKDKGLIPELIITSPAQRTLTTAEIFADHLGLPEPAKNKAIYEASEKTLLRVINAFPNEVGFVALVGHNPGIAYILQYLTGETREVHTSTTALIDFEVDDWALVTEDLGKLVYYSSPNE